ncbi:MAG: hypothetical protein V4564_04960 [Pseudomonadota bacterium]
MTTRMTRSRRTTADGETVADLAITHSRAAIAALVGVMTNEKSSDASRVSAANAILDRAWGRAGQNLDVSEDGEDFAAILSAARARVAAGRDA